MKETSVLVTGAGGELGTALIAHLIAGGSKVVALDLNEAFQPPADSVTVVHGDICDEKRISQLFIEYDFPVVFHFAALLSSAAEKNPFLSQRVNIDATSFLIEQAYEQGKHRGEPTRFIFPSSIAIYGSPDRNQLRQPLTENDCLHPETLYGIQKLFIEQIGSYFTKRGSGQFLDFRSLRYPGLISIDTLPTGGTSDYAAEMLHHANDGKSYECFVSPEAALPFMTMPDAVRAMIMLAEASAESLSRRVYNVRGFSVTAEQLRDEVLHYYPNADLRYNPVEWRDDVVNSWPDDIDDSLAGCDWGWKPEHDVKRAFTDYFLPGLKREQLKVSAG
ncbi:NAD-dependent epimerase/dehydratase family protein [bacterium]|nr:NAD-dependent epimerase/dehydratase family protein [bacterium]